MNDRITIIFASAFFGLAACSGGGSSATGTATDTDPTAGTGSDTATTSTTSPTTGTGTSSTSTSTSSTTADTTGGEDDYWNTGLCTSDPNVPSSTDCMDVDWVGTCDRNGQALWCGGSSATQQPTPRNNNLFCFVCPAGQECGPNSQGLIECVDVPSGTGSSTGTGTGTGTSTSTTG